MLISASIISAGLLAAIITRGVYEYRCLCIGIPVLYVCQLQWLIWASYRHILDRLPEAVCCYVQTCSVNVVYKRLVLMLCCWQCVACV